MIFKPQLRLQTGLRMIEADVQVPLVDRIAPWSNGWLQEYPDGFSLWREHPDYRQRLMELLGLSPRADELVLNSLLLGLENAFYHGNNNQGDLSVFLRYYHGSDGSLLSIVDSGDGFDYDKKIRMMENGERYFEHKGIGLRTFSQAPISAGYECKGNILNIVIPKLVLTAADHN